MLENTVGTGRLGYQRTQGVGAQGVKQAPPSGYRVVSVETASSQKLRDLASYRRDLELAKYFVDAYMAADFDMEATARVPEDAFWMAAITLYGRAFGSGVRLADRPSHDVLTKDQRTAHQYFVDLRNKYVAHSVNDFEQTMVIAYLTNSAFAAPAIARVGQQFIHVPHLDQEESHALAELCTVHIRDLSRRIKKLHRAVADELAEQGLDAVYAQPDLALPSLRPEAVAKRRK